MGSSDFDLLTCNMAVSSQKNPSLIGKTSYPMKKMMGVEVNDPSYVSVEGSKGAI